MAAATPRNPTPEPDAGADSHSGALALRPANLRCRTGSRTGSPGPHGMKIRSFEVTDGPTRAPARAMLRAIGMTDDDWDKPQIGVASSWNEVTPCNMPLDRLAKRAKDGVREAGGFPLEFVTIAVSDGISMGHEGMRASLVSAARSSPTRSRR